MLFALAPVAGAQQLIGNSFDGILYEVNTLTGAVTNPQNTGITSVSGIEYDSSTGTLYGITGSLSNGVGNALYSFGLDGTPTLIGATGLTSIFEGDLALDPTSGLLYGIQDAPAPNFPRNLFTINKTTGAATVFGTITANVDLSALTFDAAGNLYVLDTINETVLTVDKTNGTVLLTTNLNQALGQVAGFEFDPTSGLFYVADGFFGTSNLYTLDVPTGALSLVGPTGLAPLSPDGLAGLTILPSGVQLLQVVPEPNVVVFAGAFALLIGGLGVQRRRLVRVAAHRQH